jgi:hypothetical protein
MGRMNYAEYRDKNLPIGSGIERQLTLPVTQWNRRRLDSRNYVYTPST